ncbi:MAG: cytidylyltransferase domain-containing protein [Rummeliibacillus sp.]
MKVLFVITARGGSQGVPKKNIRVLGDLPLIAYKIISAKKCSLDKRIIVSTDDKEIADISTQYGAEVPFIRPKELASNTASSLDVVEHAMKWIEKNDSDTYDYICLLEPSSPFATNKDLENAIHLINQKKADTLLGMKEVEVNTIFINELDDKGGLSYFYKNIKELNSLRRQDQKPQYTMNGCMYIAKWDYFKKNKSFHSEKSLPYIMPVEKSIEIDSIFNLNMANYLVEKGIIDLKEWQ